MSARHYSTTKDFVTNSARDTRAGLILLQVLGVIAVVVSIILAAAGSVIGWYVAAGVTVLLVGSFLGGVAAVKSHGKRLQAALDGGPLVSIDDDILTYTGTPALWSDITEIHVVDYRHQGPLTMGEVGAVAVDIEFADIIHTIELDMVMPSGIITVMLADLRRTAEAHGIPFGTSRTNREYNAFVKADPRKKR